MTKLKLGTIGTSWITEQFIEAALMSNMYSLEAVYSRTEDKALVFKEKFSANKIYTDWDAFLNDSDIDVIYIASPNSFHFKQALDILNHEKHAIVEKPIVTSLSDWETLTSLAVEKNKMVIEAARHIYEPNFNRASEEIQKLSDINGASLTFSKYSSRYDNVLKGEEPAIFSTKFDGGAANDLGIYVVYAAVHWFGKPNSIHAYHQKVRTGVDGKGTAVLRYNGFDVTLHYGKINTSAHNTEIYGLDYTLVFDAITGLEKAAKMDTRTGKLTKIKLEKPADNPLLWEAVTFAEVMNDFESQKSKATLDKWWTLTKQVHEVLEEIRQQTK